MRITAARLQPYALPLKTEWQSAAGALSVRSGWLIRLETDAGLIGYGECAPLPSHGTEDVATAEHALNQWARTLPGQPLESALAELPPPATCTAPAARAAVETALLDLLAKQADIPLATYLCQRECQRTILVNTMLGSAISISEAVIAEAIAAGFAVIKLKVGLASITEEIEALHRIATQLPSGVMLRLDANRAWSLADAESFCRALCGLPIESLEEPLAQADTEKFRELGQNLPFHLAVDESWRQFNPEAFFEQPPLRRLVLKLAPCGGLLPALALARRAAAAGIECVVTTGVDSACGTLAAAHLAATIGNGLAHGLATSAWFADDTGTPPSIKAGLLILPEACGLGFSPTPN